MDHRHIYKSATTAQHAVRDVLTTLFVREMLVPSKTLFLVEPWISNIVIIDNRDGTFDALNPEWGRREVRLTEILASLAASGVKIYIVIRPESHNRWFLEKLDEALSDAGVHEQCQVHELAELHTKGILSDRAALIGSMNLTENGVSFNDEYVHVAFDKQTISDARVHFDTYLSPK